MCSIPKYLFASILALSAFLPPFPSIAPLFLGVVCTTATLVPSAFVVIFISRTFLLPSAFLINSCGSSDHSTSSTGLLRVLSKPIIVCPFRPIARPIWPLFRTNIILPPWLSIMQSRGATLVTFWKIDIRPSSSSVIFISGTKTFVSLALYCAVHFRKGVLNLLGGNFFFCDIQQLRNVCFSSRPHTECFHRIGYSSRLTSIKELPSNSMNGTLKDLQESR